MYQDMDPDTEPLTSKTVPSAISRVQQWKSLCFATIDPVPFGVYFAMGFSNVVSQTQIIDLTCSVIFEYNQTLCDQLGKPNPSAETQNIETTIQPYVSKILMVRGVATTLGPAVTGIFFGAWSDKFGRKPLLRLSAIGFLFCYALWTLLTFLSSVIPLSPWFYILTVIPPGLVGSYCSFLGAMYCHIADITTEKERPLKLAILDAYIAVAMFVGSLASGYVFEATNAATIFTISTVVLILTIIYLELFVPESLDSDKIQKTSKIKGLFQISLVKEMIQVFFLQRPNYARMVILISVGVLCLTVFSFDGSPVIFYLYVREQFSWTAKDFTTYSAIATLFAAGGSALSLVVLQKIFNLSSITVILVGLGSLMVDSIIKALAISSWQLYLAIFVCITKGVAFPTLRSLVATVTPVNETGKIYAVMALLEFTVPILGDPVYTFVYNSTLTIYPGFFNLVSAMIYFICYLIFTGIYVMQFYQPRITCGKHRKSITNGLSHS